MSESGYFQPRFLAAPFELALASRMAMLTTIIEDDGTTRLYFTRLGIVVSYLQASKGFPGIDAVVELGSLAFLQPYAMASEAVRRAMIEEIARRLDLPAEAVLQQSIDTVCRVVDPLLSGPDPWRGQRRSRRRRK